MKRKIAAVLALMLLAALWTGAQAESTYMGTMMVVNCDEWVSLRAAPDTGADRLAKVPLYAIVTDGEWSPGCGDFIYCCYEGQWGYILSRYLEPWADPEPEDSVLLDETLNGFHVMAERSLVGEGEYLLVTCEDAEGNQRWFHETMTDCLTELYMTEAFLGGPAQDPMVMVYNAQQGLAALDLVTGEARWRVARDLGGGVCWAVDGSGNTYIGGYYGPDPVAIDAWGNVLWEADSQGCYWLYFMELREDGLWCWYDVMDGDHEQSGEVIFDADGALVEKRYDR